jgi:acyl-CoA thioesterase
MADYQKIKKFFEQDQFVKYIDIQIEQVQDGEAICSMPIFEHHLNAGRVVQGGAVFTLADIAFAVAAGSCNHVCVSLNSTISYLRPAAGRRLSARAVRISHARRTCVYQVEVTDEEGTKVAHIVATGYVTNQKIVPDRENVN